MGLTQEVLTFGSQLVDKGFRVYLPVLFGPAPATTKGAQRRAVAQCCISRQINLLATGRTSRVVGPLRQMVADVGESHSSGVGVVGMCLSGGFALALAADTHVRASVVSRPSLPLITRVTPWCAKSLGLDNRDEDDARGRLQGGDVEIYLTRFSDDRRSPEARENTVRERLGDQGITYDVLDSKKGNRFGFKPNAHSVLTVAPTQYPSGSGQERLQKTAREVVEFLRRRLQP
jgi:dienelactone hydrolase